MSVLIMRILPDPILRRQARKVGKVPANMKKFTDDMIETMHAELGVGLAANQIGSLQKVAVIQLPDWEEALVLINPEIVKQEGEREVVEGCLSIPGYRGLVKRSVSVRARAIGLAAAFADQRAGRGVAAENTNQRCAGQIGLFSCQIGDFLWGRGPSARHVVPFACDCVLRGSPPRSQGVS